MLLGLRNVIGEFDMKRRQFILRFFEFRNLAVNLVDQVGDRLDADVAG